MGNEISYQKRMRKEEKDRKRRKAEYSRIQELFRKKREVETVIEKKYFDIHKESQEKKQEELEDFMKTYKVEFNTKEITLIMDTNSKCEGIGELGLYAIRRVYLPNIKKSIDYEIVEVTDGMVITSNSVGFSLHSHIYKSNSNCYTLLFPSNINPGTNTIPYQNYNIPSQNFYSGIPPYKIRATVLELEPETSDYYYNYNKTLYDSKYNERQETLLYDSIQELPEEELNEFEGFYKCNAPEFTIKTNSQGILTSCPPSELELFVLEVVYIQHKDVFMNIGILPIQNGMNIITKKEKTLLSFESPKKYYLLLIPNDHCDIKTSGDTHKNTHNPHHNQHHNDLWFNGNPHHNGNQTPETVVDTFTTYTDPNFATKQQAMINNLFKLLKEDNEDLRTQLDYRPGGKEYNKLEQKWNKENKS